MASPVKLFLIAFVAACAVAGGGVLYLDVGNKPMVYYSVTGAFDYEYAAVFALMGALFLGPFLFALGYVLFSIGWVFVLGFQLLLRRK
jgi:hypothetical protein